MAITITILDAIRTSGAGPGRARGRHPFRTALLGFVAATTIVTLAGCGGGSTEATPDTRSAVDVSASAGAEGSTSGGAQSSGPYTDAEACAWLKENLSKVPDTAIGAQAQLTIGLSTFFENHGGLPGADGYALDDALARGCSALHASALKKAGITSFGNL